MKILAIDCTASPASTAVVDDGKVLSSAYTNVGLTHSQTLMPMLQSTMKSAKLELDDIDIFAIDAGPGSFTGVRIGVAALKGLTLFSGERCLAVSTLESMAYNYVGVQDCVVCAAMDARRNQVYTACFEVKGDSITRLTPDSAVMLSELQEQLKAIDKNIVFVGDGAALCYNVIGKELKRCSIAPEQLRYQNAVGTAACAAVHIKNGEQPISSEQILPVYLRVPQAERELKKKQVGNTGRTQ